MRLRASFANAICILGLVVEENLLRREGQIDTIGSELVLD
jgi:hypothetical protein